MTTNTAITKTNGTARPPAPLDIMAYAGGMTAAQVDLIKRAVITGGTRQVTDNELALFLTICNRRGLDPFAKQIYGIMRKRKQRDGTWSEELVIQVSIDGYRLLAEQTDRYEGMVGPQWCGADGQWVDVWLKAEPPAAARVGVYRTGCREPFWGIATYREFAETRDGKPVGKWVDMPAHMLSKVAEAAAIRKAFPQAVSGLTTPETACADTETDHVTERDRETAALEARLAERRRVESGPGRRPWVEESDEPIEAVVTRTALEPSPAASPQPPAPQAHTAAPEAPAKHPTSDTIAVNDAPAGPTAPQDAPAAQAVDDVLTRVIRSAATVQVIETLAQDEGWDEDRHRPIASARVVELVSAALDGIDWGKSTHRAIEQRLATAVIKLDPLPADTPGRNLALDKLEAARQRLAAELAVPS